MRLRQNEERVMERAQAVEITGDVGQPPIGAN
jgi:hypothetical protein